MPLISVYIGCNAASYATFPEKKKVISKGQIPFNVSADEIKRLLIFQMKVNCYDELKFKLFEMNLDASFKFHIIENTHYIVNSYE